MIAYRFQAWTVSPERAGEFHRTRRRRPGPWVLLTRRYIESCGYGAMILDHHRAKRPRPRWLDVRRRPATRTAPRVRSGPIRCVKLRSWMESDGEFCGSGRTHRRGYCRPPASVAAHRLAAWGFESCAF